MKKLLIIAILIPMLFACKQVDPVSSLSGTVDNLEEGFFILGGPGGASDSIFINEDNTFDFEIGEIDKAVSYYIAFEREILRFRIAPKQAVELYFDKSDFIKSVKFIGTDASINNYLADNNRDENILPAGPDVYILEYPEYKEWADNNLKAGQDLLKNTIKDDETDTFWATEEGDLLYKWASSLGMYEAYHKYYAKVETVVLPDDYESYKDKLDPNMPEYLESRAFTSYLQNLVRTATNEKIKDVEDADKYMVTLETAEEVLTDQEVIANVRVNYLKGQLSWVELSKLTDAIAFLKKNVTDEELMADFNKELEEWKTLAAGQPGFDFIGKDLEGNEVKFSDFKGKYVYVDVWATWCSPCRYEIPFLKQLEADYHERNIVFISYSIDSDKQAWLDFVPKEELGGVQIIGEDAWQSEMPLFYKVRGVPTFMFFDAEGKIVNVKMTRPSNQATRDTFDSYSDL